MSVGMLARSRWYCCIMGVSASAITPELNQGGRIASFEFASGCPFSRRADGRRSMEPFSIRLATVDDADTIARHRASMFGDMGEIPQELFEDFRAKSRERIYRMLQSGEYVGWLACLEDDGRIVAGAGVQLRQVMPHPATNPEGKVYVAQGRHALVINVFTEREWRRRGLAALLIKQIVDWSREQQLDRLILHAAREARSIYERLGFVPTNEMKFGARLPGSSSSPAG